MKKNSYVVILIVTVVGLFSFKSREIVPPTPYRFQKTFSDLSRHIPADNRLTEEGVWLGRLLFYDRILSGNNSQSCGDCHKQELAFTDGYPLAIGSKGDTVNRNTMSLINLAWQSNFFWDGRAHSLEELVRVPISNPQEMDQDTLLLIEELKTHAYYPALFQDAFPGDSINMVIISKALAQFLRTIVSSGVNLPDSIFPQNLSNQYLGDLSEQQLANENSPKGSFVRLARMCSRCHGGKIYGDSDLATNMIPDTGVKMKIPSLINITLTAPYMHDGRFNNLKEVMKHYSAHIEQFHLYNPSKNFSQIENIITEYDIDHIEDLFKFFTDTTIVKDKNLSNPFLDKNFTWTKN